jgi:hypothetical protein
MTTVLKPKRSEVQYSIPGTSDLQVGELAMNIRDGKFYTKDSFNVVKEIGGAGSVSFQTVLSNGNKTTYDVWLNGSNLVFEGNYENAFHTNLTVVEPTQTRTIALPNDNGTLAMDGDALAYSIVFG